MSGLTFTKEPIYEESKRGVLEKAGLYNVIYMEWKKWSYF